MPTSIFTDKYWGIYIANNYYAEIQKDTLTLVQLKDRDAIFRGPTKGGFIFYSNGTYEQFNYRKCGFDPVAKTGKWTYENGIIILKSNNYSYQFKPEVTSRQTLILKYWYSK